MTTEETPAKFDRELLNELARGAQKVFENAEALFFEAKILSAAGALSRALFLHQISLEECAKIETMGAWAVSILAGIPVEGDKVLLGLTRHANKNRTNAYMLEGSAEELAARERGDWGAALAEFKRLQEEFHAKSNAAKNASLYVDFESEKFFAPVDKITADMVGEIATRNETFLGLMFPKVKMLSKWAQVPEETQESVVAFIRLAEAARAKKQDDAMAAIKNLIDEFLQSELAKRVAKTGKDEADA